MEWCKTVRGEVGVGCCISKGFPKHVGEYYFVRVHSSAEGVRPVTFWKEHNDS